MFYTAIVVLCLQKTHVIVVDGKVRRLLQEDRSRCALSSKINRAERVPFWHAGVQTTLTSVHQIHVQLDDVHSKPTVQGPEIDHGGFESDGNTKVIVKKQVDVTYQINPAASKQDSSEKIGYLG